MDIVLSWILRHSPSIPVIFNLFGTVTLELANKNRDYLLSFFKSQIIGKGILGKNNNFILFSSLFFQDILIQCVARSKSDLLKYP